MLHFKPFEKLCFAFLFLTAFGFTLANSGITEVLPETLPVQEKGLAKITGKVTDKVSKEAIPGANIFLVGTKLGSASNFKGEFVIKNVPPGTYKISVQFLGYKEETQELTVEASKNEESKYMMDFALERTRIGYTPRTNIPKEEYSSLPKIQSKPGYGKIRGNVSSNGEALPGANVLIMGTRLGSATDPMGNFLIMNVPPGVYELNVDMIGYKSKRVKNLRVGADLTTTIDFKLEATRERPLTTKPVNGWDDFYKKIELPGKRAYVSAEVLLEKDGKVTEIKLKQSSGDSHIDEVVLKAIAETKWTPLIKEDKPIKTSVAIQVRFPQKNEIEFVPYDTAPEPIGGFAAIQKNLRYPEIARRAGIEGIVILHLQINKEGEILKIEVQKSLGNNGCDEAAIDAVRKVRWNPAIRKDKPVKVWVSIPVQFKLNENKTQAPSSSAETPVFVPYDSPPEPIGGFEAIQKNLDYPEIARRAGIQGMVIAQVLIDTDGKVVKTKIVKSLGENNGCDEAAVAALTKTKWKPAKQKDTPVKVWVSIPVQFKLKEQMEGFGKIEGVVKDGDGNPIKHAAIIIPGTEFKEYSNEEGAFIILNVPPGKYDLICGLPDYEAAKKNAIEIEKIRNEIKNLEETPETEDKIKKLEERQFQLVQEMKKLKFKKEEKKEIKVFVDDTVEINFVLK